MTRKRRHRLSTGTRPAKGFTLTELAIVMIIVALMIGGLLVSASTARDIADSEVLQKKQLDIQAALLGFAAVSGRLPCPASATSNGREAFCTASSGGCVETTTEQAHGRCSVPRTGFLPAVTLGISPTDSQGYALDPWNNRMRYAVTQASAGTIAFPFTAATGIRDAWTVNPANLAPDLRVCSTAAGATGAAPNTACAANTSLTDNAIAVIMSIGKNGSQTPAAGSDERANWTDSDDRLFVSKVAADFDDVVLWVSPNLLYNRLITAGRL